MKTTVAVLGLQGPSATARCLNALRLQEGVDEVVVTHPPTWSSETLSADHPRVRFVRNDGQTSPLELTSRALREAEGDIVLVTKDWCVPDPGWASALVAALDGPAAAVGGPIRIPEEADAIEFAFTFIDFHPYVPPVPAGPTGTLSVCNLAYRRTDLDRIREVWQDRFQETVVHAALCRLEDRPLVMVEGAAVTLHRPVLLETAVKERYALGRLFAAERLPHEARPTALGLRFLGPSIPALLMTRMGRRALEDPELRRRFVQSLGPLALMSAARGAGEWLGYLTGRPR